jgi:predicted acylesterase/phospholipase RssA
MARGAAIVIGGAVAKGAFAAGALAELTKRLQAAGTSIRRLVGTSSGALNAAMLAAGVRAGDPLSASARLTELWEERADIWHVFEPDLASWIRLRGASGTHRIVELLRNECPIRGSFPAQHVSLRMVVAPLAGVGTKPTTFEHVERFDGADLDVDDARERIFQAAAASAAFPFAFGPVTLSAVGPCVDGGIVNNTPIREALDGEPGIDVVYVISAEPTDMSLTAKEAAALGGSDLLLRLVDMLIDERLTRDLAEARAVNGWVAKLAQLEVTGALAPGVRDEVIRGLYPTRDPRTLREVELVEIRQCKQLEGSAFEAFFRPGLRHEYVEAGRAAAKEAAIVRDAPA